MMAAIACSVALRSRPDGVQGRTTTSATATAAPTAYSCGGVSMIVVAPGIDRIMSAHCAAPPTPSGNSETLNGNRPGAAHSAADRCGSASMTSTNRPRRCSSPAKLIAMVVLPTPPLRWTTDMIERTYPDPSIAVLRRPSSFAGTFCSTEPCNQVFREAEAVICCRYCNPAAKGSDRRGADQLARPDCDRSPLAFGEMPRAIDTLGPRRLRAELGLQIC